ncbi:hypothetical protein PILCRDRAFT_1964 [Piloderma croceum F 1598]|uniref:Oxidase ustYa n=1 Tax=Piloderma croceum (strain F 1598) TaxID=765440 RepID=A0A0C3BSZ0_PILCF|nr:hypothetical protein PILCRDRAFT_1964 [Piloderma croceum F 1598]
MLKHLNYWFSNKSRTFVLASLAVSLLFNVLTMRRVARSGLVDDSQYSYIGDDHPTELPLRLDNVAMKFEDMAQGNHYSISGVYAWLDWHSLDYFPKGPGFVRLGPNGRQFGVSMFHQIHCLNMIRMALINGADGHSGHCMNFLRQAILCAADTTIEDTAEVTHVCKDWTQVYAHVTENQNGPYWLVPANTTGM